MATTFGVLSLIVGGLSSVNIYSSKMDGWGKFGAGIFAVLLTVDGVLLLALAWR